MKSKGNTMSPTVLDNIRGNEIPPVWLKKTKENPNKIFKITRYKVQTKKQPLLSGKAHAGT